MSARALIPGVRFDFGGERWYVVPPLSLGVLQMMQTQLNELPSLSATDPVAVSTMVDATLAALRRNYPEMTKDEVGELIDVGNMAEVFQCLMDVGGVKRRAQQEAARGNAPAESQSAGTGSSPESAQTPAGPGTTSATT